jgi:hypothetical protein
LSLGTGRGTAQQFLVREVPLRHALDELGREQIAQILVASMQAFVEHHLSSTPEEVARSFADREPPQAQAIGPSDTVPTAPPAARPQVSSSPPWRPMLGALYAVSHKGQEGIAHGPGVLVGVARAASRVRWGLGAKAQYEFPVEGRGQRIVVSTDTMAFRLAALVESWMFHHFGWGAELGAGFDSVAFSPRRSAGVLPRPGGSDLRPVAVTALRGSIGFPDWRLSLTAGITTVLVERHYDLAVSGQPERDLVPWRVQPTLGVEASWP